MKRADERKAERAVIRTAMSLFRKNNQNIFTISVRQWCVLRDSCARLALTRKGKR